MKPDLSASVRARLLNIAKAQQADFNQVLVRYALERFLYRLSQSPYADQFMLKGALLFTLWYDLPHRATRDADLLGFGPSDLATLSRTFSDIAGIAVEDGIVFDASSISLIEIRKETGYVGARVVLTGELARARCKTQIDIGFGDAVTPAAIQSVFPVLINDFPAPRIRTYPVYTVIAEKLHAISVLGMSNTRLKDYLDLSIVLERESLNMHTLAAAIAATFQRRGTRVPVGLPTGLTDEFANDFSRQALWTAFLKKNGMTPVSLIRVVTAISRTLGPALADATLLQIGKLRPTDSPAN